MEPWESLDVDDSDLSSFIRPSKRQTLTLDPIELSQRESQTHNLNPTPSTSALKPCSQSRSQFRGPRPASFPESPISSPVSSTVDSQVLLSDSPPPVETSASLRREIPGPAGAVQAAMQRKARGLGNSSLVEDGEAPVPTQEYIRRAVEDGGEDDGDFALNPWVYAVDYVRRKGLVGGEGAAIGTPLCSIKSGYRDKVDQVVAVIKSCTPNGLGDLMVTLKDPTGTIGGSIHRRVVAEKDFGKEISVGAVLILQKVAVFSPSRFARYLNITLNNVIQVISKDVEALPGLNHLATTVQRTSCVGASERSGVPEGAASADGGREIKGIMDSFRKVKNHRGTIHNNKEYEQPVRLQMFDSRNNVGIEDHTSSVEKPIGNGCQTGVATAEIDAVINDRNPEGTSGSDQQAGLGEGSSMGNNTRWHSSMPDMNKFSQRGSGTVNTSSNPYKEQKAAMISRTLPQWTDEQLDQLLEYD